MVLTSIFLLERKALTEKTCQPTNGGECVVNAENTDTVGAVY
jgi:hypothetical protein